MITFIESKIIIYNILGWYLMTVLLGIIYNTVYIKNYIDINVVSTVQFMWFNSIYMYIYNRYIAHIFILFLIPEKFIVLGIGFNKTGSSCSLRNWGIIRGHNQWFAAVDNLVMGKAYSAVQPPLDINFSLYKCKYALGLRYIGLTRSYNIRHSHVTSINFN